MKRTEPMSTPASHPPTDASADDRGHQARIAGMVARQPERVAEVAVDLWERLSTRLVMIIGNDGFAALYDRSLHLASASHPWLAPDDPPAGTHSRFARLKSGLQERQPDDAQAASVLLLTTFTDVLVTLIGQQLTTNILRAAWGDAYEPAAQE